MISSNLVDNNSQDCAAGSYSAAGAVTCTQCSGGTWSSAGLASCNQVRTYILLHCQETIRNYCRSYPKIKRRLDGPHNPHNPHNSHNPHSTHNPHNLDNPDNPDNPANPDNPDNPDILV